jgi:glycosyl hydrolase family 12
MIRRLSCVSFSLLLPVVILISPGWAADQTLSATWASAPLRPDADYPARTFAYNNLWNTRGARGSQSITVYDSDTEPLWSTTWDWKRGQGYTVTSYASTVTGWHWGETYKGVVPPVPFETPDLIPVPLSELQAVTTAATYRYEKNSACDGKRAIICRYDVAYDLWFHDHDPTGRGDAPAFELMVWLDYSWDDLWIGYTPVATVQIPAETGPFWKIFQTASTNAVFVPADKGNAVKGVTLNLVEFIKEANNQNLISDAQFQSWWLSSVEFGIEVYQGKGTFTVDTYTLTID